MLCAHQQHEVPLLGLLVSKFGFGSFVTFDMQMDFEKSYAVFEYAFKSGINFFDSAETYADGEAEKFIGKIVKTGVERGVWSREDLVLTTKLFFGTKLAHGGGGPNDTGLSRKHVIEGMKGSLKRFDLDYVDVIFCHRQDPYTPMEEIVRAMNYVIDQGWACYWGTSEWTGAEIIEACDVADRLSLIHPICDQTRYNILDRSRVDYDFVSLYKVLLPYTLCCGLLPCFRMLSQKYKYGITAFSALSSGVLTGKYNDGIPEGLSHVDPVVYEDSLERSSREDNQSTSANGDCQGNRLHASTTSYRMVRCQHKCVHCPSWCFENRATRRESEGSGV